MSLSLNRRMTLKLGRRGSGLLSLLLADLPAGTTAFEHAPLENGIPRYYRITAYADDGGAPATPTNPLATGSDGSVNVTWDAVAGADGYKVYGSDESGFTVTPGANESAPTAEVSAAPVSGPPSTGSEILILEADSITGKAEDDTLATGDWEDQSPLASNPSLFSSPTYKAAAGPAGGPAVDFVAGASLVATFGATDILAADTYVALVVGKAAASGHLDSFITGPDGNKDVLMWYNFGGTLLWRLYNGGAVGSDTVSTSSSQFADWGFLKIHNNRKVNSGVFWNGVALRNGQASTVQINTLSLLSGLAGQASAFVVLRNPSAQDVTDWETYLSSKYGVTGGGELAPAIALVTADDSHAAATNTKAALESIGYAVGYVEDSVVTTHDFGVYDAVVTVRSAADAATLRGLIDGGTPLVLGGVESGMSVGTGRTHRATSLDLTGTWQIWDTTSSLEHVQIVNVAHAITDALALGNLQVTMGANWFAALDSAASYVGTLLADGESASVADGRSSTIAIESGTTDLAANTIDARVVVASWIYAGQTDYSADGKTLLGEIMEWILA